MITPPVPGVAFSDSGDGDIRRDRDRRNGFSEQVGLDPNWASVSQVHGNDVRHVEGAGDWGEADAMWTSRPGLALAIFTADCFGVVVHAEDAVGVAHAGWRGAEGRVVERLRDEMSAAGHEPVRAAVGPGIGPCCFEVGTEVAEVFADHVSRTTWGTTSVDLADVVNEQLEGLDTWTSNTCTHHDPGLFSHRRDSTTDRMVTLGWLP